MISIAEFRNQMFQKSSQFTVAEKDENVGKKNVEH
jgi:hypothetical protein